jgi:hypothetical protein
MTVDFINKGEQADRLLKTAFTFLVIQNVLLTLGLFLYFTYKFPLFYLLLNLDLLGFLLVAIGFILYSTQITEYKKYYFGCGLCFLGWLLCRLLAQYIIPFVFLQRGEAFYDLLMSFRWGGLDLGTPESRLSDKLYILPSIHIQRMMYLIILGGVLLGIGSILVFCAQRDLKGLTFMIYGIINLIGVYFLVPFQNLDTAPDAQGTMIKVFIVPVLGILVFSWQLSLWRKKKGITHLDA